MARLKSSEVLGTQQSPIDIELAMTLNSPFAVDCLDVKYKGVSSVAGTFKDANFELDTSLRLVLKFRANTYRLVKLHFHDACEHTIDGKEPSTFEVHFVHQLEDALQDLQTDKLVLAAFFQVRTKAKRRPAFGMLSKLVKDRRKRTARVAQTIDSEHVEGVPLRDFVPSDLTQWFTYQGSLTSYPFTEDVTWVLVRNPEAVPKADIDELRKHGAKQDHRDVQPLNRRFVLRNFGPAAGARTRHR